MRKNINYQIFSNNHLVYNYFITKCKNNSLYSAQKTYNFGLRYI